MGVILNKMSQKVVVPVAQRRAFVISCGSSEHISAHNVVSADGRALPPMIIFKGCFPGGPYNANGPINCLYATSDSGFMNGDLYLQWFTKHFLKYAPPERPILLLQDGHSSHVTPALIDAAKANNVILFCLPPHTTHCLQPLDVAVYRGLKAHFSRLLSNARLLKNNVWITKKNVSGIYKLAFQETFIMRTICEGFRKCGIFPFNPNAIDMSLLNPSQIVPGAADLQTDRTITGGEALAINEPGPAIADQPDRDIPDLPQQVGEEDISSGEATVADLPADGVARPCPPVMALNALESALTANQIEHFD